MYNLPEPRKLVWEGNGGGFGRVTIVNGHICLNEIIRLGWGNKHTIRRAAKRQGWDSERLSSSEVDAMLKMAKDEELVGSRASRTTWVHVARLKTFLQDNCSANQEIWEGGVYHILQHLQNEPLVDHHELAAMTAVHDQSPHQPADHDEHIMTTSGCDSSHEDSSHGQDAKDSSIICISSDADSASDSDSEAESSESVSETQESSESDDSDSDNSDTSDPKPSHSEGNKSTEPYEPSNSDSEDPDSESSKGKAQSSMPWSPTLASQQLKLGTFTAFTVPRARNKLLRRTKFGIQPEDANPKLIDQVDTLLQHFLGDINPIRKGGNLEDSSLKKLCAVIDLYIGYLVAIKKLPKTVSDT